MNNLKGFEKLRKKYGEFYFEPIVGDNKVVDTLYYFFLLDKQSVKRDTISTYLFFGLALVFTIASFWVPSLTITSIILLVLGVQSGLNVRIDNLKIRLDREDLMDSVRNCGLDTKVADVLHKELSKIENS